MERREVKSRGNIAIRQLAQWLCTIGVTPNQISTVSALVALVVPYALIALPGRLGWMMALLAIQMRLLANVVDGLVAVEGGKGTALGAIYNEFPDRIADSVILVGMGYAVHAPAWGWACALLAALTAYIRVFGGALGQPQAFLGPMAKQHRMAVASAALVGSMVVPGLSDYLLQFALAIIAIGSAITCGRRTRHIAQQLTQQEKSA